MNPLLRAALAGAASGGRGLTGLAALTLASPPLPDTQPDQTLSIGWVKGGAAFLAVSELALDKLPQAPSRLEPPGLGLRCATAAAAGVIIARRVAEPDAYEAIFNPVAVDPLVGDADFFASGELKPDQPPAPDTARTVACAAVAIAAAVGASWLGVRWRAWAASRTGHDYPGALLEDAVAASLAALSARG